MKMPSKKLLEHVFGEKIYQFEFKDDELRLYDFEDVTFSDCNSYRSFNIYELMHLMKWWALTKSYQLHSAIRTGAYPLCVMINEATGKKTHCKDDTEFEAVTKACEYILEQTNEPE